MTNDIIKMTCTGTHIFFAISFYLLYARAYKYRQLIYFYVIKTYNRDLINAIS